MSNFKGVPGPWGIGTSSRHGVHCVDAVDPKDGLLFEVCEVWGIDENTEETERSWANARLIAAAPDLLGEHEEWAALIGSVYVMIQQGDAEGALSIIHESEVIDFSKGAPFAVSPAIVKATGESQ